MLIRVCDRCGVTIAQSAAMLPVALPIGDPAMKPKAVTLDPFSLSVAFDLKPATGPTAPDLCSVCLISAVITAVVLLMAGSGLSAKQAQFLEAKIDAAVGT